MRSTNWNRTKKLLRSTIRNTDFVSFKNRVKLNKTVFYVELIPYSIAGIKGKLVFCFNEKKSRILKEAHYDEITHAKKMLSGGKDIKDGIEKFVRQDGRLIMRNVKAAEELDGYSAIFTTTSLSKENIVKMYFDKDLVEKAFQNMKGIINLRPIRHWLYNRVIAHVFMCYLAYLLLSILKIKLEKIEIKPLQALKEVDTLYKVYLKDKKKDFKFHKVVALNKTQEKIIKAVGKKLLTEY